MINTTRVINLRKESNLYLIDFFKHMTTGRKWLDHFTDRLIDNIPIFIIKNSLHTIMGSFWIYCLPRGEKDTLSTGQQMNLWNSNNTNKKRY